MRFRIDEYTENFCGHSINRICKQTNALTELQLQQIAKCNYARQRLRVVIPALTPKHRVSITCKMKLLKLAFDGNVHHSPHVDSYAKYNYSIWLYISIVQANQEHQFSIFEMKYTASKLHCVLRSHSFMQVLRWESDRERES